MGFERYTYLVSPIHSLDARVKILSALAIVLTVVLSGPPKALEVAGLASLLLAVGAIAGVPPLWLLSRSALVIPFAGMIALFAPLSGGGSLSVGGVAEAYSGGGWIAAYTIIAKAWLSVLTLTVLSATTPVPRLLEALRRLRMPAVMLMMLSFIYRYAGIMGRQLTSLRTAVHSRAPAISRLRTASLYGSLAGNMFVRAFERGERIHGAMLSRGYTGVLPVAERSRLSPPDLLLVLSVGMTVSALALY